MVEASLVGKFTLKSLFKSLILVLPLTTKVFEFIDFTSENFDDGFFTSNSSSISPTISSIISSNVTIPKNSPYSSTTIEKCSFLF